MLELHELYSMIELSKIILKPGKERSLRNFHPWLFSGAIAKTEGNINEGDVVKIFSSTNEFLATGHYHQGTITVRVFSFEDKEINLEFWRDKLQDAYYLRSHLNLTNNFSTDVYRLVNAEGDGMLNY